MDPAPTVVIFGASGDLTARKLIPSLYRLHRKRRIPDGLRVLGVARSLLTDDAFRDKLAAALREFSKSDWDETTWVDFARRVRYCPADATQADGVQAVEQWLVTAEGGQAAPRLYYLSVAPELDPLILRRLGEAGMNTGPAWRRVVVEKPFGHDLTSARDLNRIVAQNFREDQVFRIDHYLGKETVQNILVFRFANTIVEPLWNQKYIDHVQITVAESVKVGSRGDYYDRSGVLRDMFQNHLLQVLTLVAMEAPARFNADTLRNEKVKVLDAVRVHGAGEAGKCVVTGQYAGYRSEKGVKPDSRTPTYAAARLEVNNWRWQGVPFYLRSGKGLATRASEVVIQYRCPPHLLFPLPKGKLLECNRLSLCLQPDEGVHVRFQTKVPDEGEVRLAASDLEFHYSKAYPDVVLPEAYERLLQDALAGDAALFMRSDEIERAWEIVDPLIAAAERGDCGAPQEYAVGSEGPRSANELLAREGREWLALCRH